MLNSQILDVVIGLATMYLFQSILISGINDLLVSLLAIRGKILKNFLLNALKTKDAKDEIFNKISNSPFINTLKRKNRFPSDISAKNFSDALIETITREDSSDNTLLEKVKQNINTLPDSEFKTIMIRRLEESGDNYEKFKTSVEEWFNSYMERISYWYKKRVSYFMYLFAFVTTIALNVDSFYVMNELWKNNKLRDSVVSMSAEITRSDYHELLQDSIGTKDTAAVGQALDKIKTNYDKLTMLDFPITWAYAYKLQHNNGEKIGDLSVAHKINWTLHQFTLEKILGFLITTLAVSIGAPIWYDLLKKLIGAREMLKKNKA